MVDDNPEIRNRLNVNKSTYHNKRFRKRFICFIRRAKWMKINRLNGPSPMHDPLTWLNQSIQSIVHVCCWLGMQKISLESASEQLSAITIYRQLVLLGLPLLPFLILFYFIYLFFPGFVHFTSIELLVSVWRVL